MMMTVSLAGIDSIKGFKSAAAIAHQASQGGLKLIKDQEGLRLVAYQDTAGVWTIGWGSTRYANGKPVKQGDHLKDKATADQLLIVTLKEYTDTVNRVVKVAVNQNQFDALVSLAYNIGAAGLAESTLIRKLNAGDYAGAADQFLVWNKSRNKETKELEPNVVLTRRRRIERNLFNQPLAIAE